MNKKPAVHNLTVDQLEVLTAIQKEKDELNKKIGVLNDRIDAIWGVAKRTKTSERNGSTPGVKVSLPRGTKKSTILGHLEAAGRNGLTVLKLVDATGYDRQTIDRWLFSGSAKKVRGLRKLGPAHYVYLPSGKSPQRKS